MRLHSDFMLDSVLEEKARNLNSIATHDFYCKRRPEDYSNKIVCENFFKRRASCDTHSV